MVTIFKSIYSDEPNYISVDRALQRIKEGRSKETVEKIRSEQDPERRQELKKRLPCVCFSGKFNERKDSSLLEHSSYVILDFDHCDTSTLLSEVCAYNFVKAAWISPSGDGLKVLCKLRFPSKHREHFKALKKLFVEADKSGINESRVCYESYDPNIFIRENPSEFEDFIEEEVQVPNGSDEDIKKLVTWLAKDNRYFVKGERNTFIFVLACACCRYGIDIEDVKQFCYYEYFLQSSDFSKREGDNTIESAYRTERSRFGTVSFKKDELVDSKGEKPTFEGLKEGDKVKDVIYGDDVYTDVMSIIENGYPSLHGLGVPKLDELFKAKRGQINLMTGYGNHGKSAWLKWYLAVRSLFFGEKYAFFAPEEGGADEFYLSLTEILAGCWLNPKNPNKPSKREINEIYTFVREHFFFIHPEELAPTPQYIKDRFMYLMFTEKVDGVIIDPFNQMTNDYKSAGGRDDRYLEVVLSDFKKFASSNNIYFWVVAHPRNPQKNSQGGYDAPTEYDLSNGAMWANKMDNIIVYHRPFAWSDPKNPACEIHTRKIKKVGVNGMKGFVEFEYDMTRKRFIFDGFDVLYKKEEKPLEIVNNITTFEAEKKEELDDFKW